jgi:tetratricopeptide (TPR) repeat protein
MPWLIKPMPNHKTLGIIRSIASAITTMIVAIAPAISIADDGLQTRLKTGIDYQMRSNVAGVAETAHWLKETYPKNAIGYVFNLNGLITEFSWDESVKTYDASIFSEADEALERCKRQIKNGERESLAQAYFLCGQAHFALTYLHGARGNYYRAGTNGSDTIEHLEKALEYDPTLIDAKMHLGAAYYFADNLPPFVRAFSSLLWFIPSGNSAKALPYLREVAEGESLYAPPAKYMYAWMLLQGDAADQDTATQLLAELVKAYPQSRRFYLRYVSHLVLSGEYETASIAARKFIAGCPDCQRKTADVDLARIWLARASLDQGEVGSAQSTLSQISEEPKPRWADAWQTLTVGNIADLNGERSIAVDHYQRVLDLAGQGGVSSRLRELALSSLEQPYDVGSSTNSAGF